MLRSGLVLILIAAFGRTSGIPTEEVCDDPVICVEKPPSYDQYQDHIDDIVQQNKALMSPKFYNDALADIEPVTTGDEQNCVGITSVEAPFMIKTNVSVEYVIQSKYFEQKIRVTKCKYLDSPCMTTVKSPGFGIKTACEEKLGAVSLFIYDPATKEVNYKMFQVPICCFCKFITETGGKK